MRTVSYDSQSIIVHGQRVMLAAAGYDSVLIDPARWPGDLAALRAIGFNAIAVRVPWLMHEPWPDHFDFTGSRDIARLVQLARDAGLMVLLRAGPVVGENFSLGGIPAWMTELPGVRLREANAVFLDRVNRFWMELFARVESRCATNERGGAIVAVSLEDDWRCLDADLGEAYFTALVRAAREKNIRVPLLSCNNCWFMHDAVIDCWRQQSSVYTAGLELAQVQVDAPRVLSIAPNTSDHIALARTIAAAVAARASFIVEDAVAVAHAQSTYARDAAQQDGVVLDARGCLHEGVNALRRVLAFANTISPSLSMLTPQSASASDPESASAPCVCVLEGAQGARVSVAFMPRALTASTQKPANSRSKKGKSPVATHTCADGSSFVTPVVSVTGVEFYASDLVLRSDVFAHGIALTRCTGSLVALVQALLVIAGEAGSIIDLVLDGNASKFTVPPAGAAPLVMKMRALHVVVVASALADTIECGTDFVRFTAAKETVFQVTSDGQVTTQAPNTTTLMRNAKLRAIIMSAPRVLRQTAMLDGSDARFASVTMASSLAAMGVREGLGFYRATWKEARKSKPVTRTLALAQSRGVIALSIDGVVESTTAQTATRTVALPAGMHTLVAAIEEIRPHGSTGHEHARAGVFGPLLDLEPLVGVTLARSEVPAFDATQLGAFVHGYDMRGGAATLKWSFAPRTDAIVIDLPLNVRGALRLNGELIASLDEAATPSQLFVDGAKLSPMRVEATAKGEQRAKKKDAKLVAGPNELLLDLETELDAATRLAVASRVKLYEVRAVIDAQWAFARVMPPASWVLAKPYVAEASSHPASSTVRASAWFQQTFTLTHVEALHIKVTETSAALRIFVNGEAVMSIDSGRDSTHWANIAQHTLRAGENELVVFAGDGVLPVITLR